MSIAARQPDVEDAIQFIVRYIQGRTSGRIPSETTYGYDVYLRNVMGFYLTETGSVPPGTPSWHVVDARASELSPVFAAAAWSLCRRGFLRPGVHTLNKQATDEGSGGFGFSITPTGRDWIASGAANDYLPVEHGRFGRMLAEQGSRFGPGFVERSQEAVRAYNALAYLACCAMCGAASESVLLSLAIAQRGDEARALAEYAGANGRSRVEARLLGHLPEPTRNEFRRYSDLLKYWRDSAAHGRAVRITEAEAYTSLVLLLRFAIFASDRWDELTAQEQP